LKHQLHCFKSILERILNFAKNPRLSAPHCLHGRALRAPDAPRSPHTRGSRHFPTPLRHFPAAPHAIPKAMPFRPTRGCPPPSRAHRAPGRVTHESSPLDQFSLRKSRDQLPSLPTTPPHSSTCGPCQRCYRSGSPATHNLLASPRLVCAPSNSL
jgi:hypothetical protein